MFVAVACLMTGAAAAVAVQQSQALISSKSTPKTHTPINVDKLKAAGTVGCLTLSWIPPIGAACTAAAAFEFGWNLGDFLNQPTLQKGVDLGCSVVKADTICKGISGIETAKDLLTPPQPTTCADGSQPDAKGNCGTSSPPLPPMVPSTPTPATQTCPDGSVIDASATCPTPTPPAPQTQTCPDGSVIDASATCPTPTPPAPQTQTCPDGSVIDASATCPQPQQPQNNPPPDQQQQPSVDCNANPNDPSCTPPSSGK